MTIDICTNKIRAVGNRLLKQYADSELIETGLNGPYDDDETEVRYLAHLLVIATIECKLYGHHEYRDLINNMGEKLLSMKDANHVYRMRVKPGKDECNGVIGHAWLIEGLLYAYKATGDDKYLEESERICVNHAFNNKIGLWGRPLMGNSDSAIDYTFNHELWYAATLAELLQARSNTELQRQLDAFLEKLPEIVTINREGRVAHGIYCRISKKAAFKCIIARLRDVTWEKLSKPNLRYKEVGYHVFNLMAFARLYRILPKCEFWNTKSFKAALDFVKNNYFFDELEQDNILMDASTHGDQLTKEETSVNIYGYPYNVPGFELMYCKEVFGDKMDEKITRKILSRQMELTWDEENGIFGKLCHDKVSINYRVYEYYRYLEVKG